ncbi:MAG: hypothetical protein U0R50_05030 [Gaiellales bacterium]
MELLPDLDQLDENQKGELIARLEEEETQTSLRRRMLHGRIDFLRKEYEERLKARIESGEQLPALDPKDLDRPIFDASEEPVPEHDLGPMPVVEELTDEALRGMIKELEAEEDSVSFHRRVLQGHLDIIRNYRPGDPLDVKELAKMLSGTKPGGSAA